MKRYIYALFIGTLLSLTSCVMDDSMMNQSPINPGAGSGIQIIGAAEDFDIHNVGTRASGVVSDSYITEMTMLIFKENGDMLPAFADIGFSKQVSSHIHIEKANPTFLIEATKYPNYGVIASMEVTVDAKYYENEATDLDKCSIYIVANAWHLIGERLENNEIKTLDDLMSALVDTDPSLAMPKKVDGEGNESYIGLPMIGTHEAGTTFNLSYNGGNSTNSVATIPLKKLYSKVYFRLQVNANQIVEGGPTPKFSIDNAEVYNVPSKIRMGYKSGDYIENIGNEYIYTYPADENRPSFAITDFNKKTIYHSSSATTDDVIEFSFFIPEHKVTPYDITYPWDASNNVAYEKYRQYFKPKGVAAGSDGTGLAVPAKISPFVRINGSYTDHNGRIKSVSYDIYLGQNEYNDFEIKRNQQLNNYLTITGITNHKDAYIGGSDENISIDHRVTIADRGYNIYMEREAILDSHFEVRPIDFELQNGSALTIVIPQEYQGWIAMEDDAAARSGKNASLYIDNTNAKRGVRKYFTTNLVSELTGANSGQITLEHSSRSGGTNPNPNPEHFRVWFYVDENPNVYDKTGTAKQTSESGDYTVTKNLYRLAPVKLYYTNTATDNPDVDGESVHTINFQQWNLWRVWNAAGTRYYDIEHEEEYLNNYASNEGYGTPQNGMQWGLDGIQLSNKVKAMVIEETTGIVAVLDYIGFDLKAWYSSLVNDLPNSPDYDFYLSRDNFPTDELDANVDKSLYTRDYQGRVLNQEIAATLKKNYSSNPLAKIEGILLNESPQSAFAYCYNKNKRDNNGNVVEQKWILPAIDEIEEISKGAYDEFDRVFQNQIYWSCQTAFDKNRLSMPVSVGIPIADAILGNPTLYADYYTDDLDRARATKVFTTDGTNFQNIGSGVPGYAGTQNGKMNWTTPSFTDYVPNTLTFGTTSDTQGNLSRTEKCRIRAVYRSGERTRN